MAQTIFNLKNILEAVPSLSTEELRSYSRATIRTAITALEELDRRRKNIGHLRQWLNEDRIKDSKKMVTNEDIESFLSM